MLFSTYVNLVRLEWHKAYILDQCIIQNCRGLEVGMEGATHRIRSLWDVNENDEDDWGCCY